MRTKRTKKGMRRLTGVATIVATAVTGLPTGHAQEAAGSDHPGHLVPMFPNAADQTRQGFVRVLNHSDRSGEVQILAIDDEGIRYGPATLTVDAGETLAFNSTDLEEGNMAKDLANGVGSGTGHWRLQLESGLDIEVLSYIRTPVDGFLTSMHDLVPVDEDGRRRVAMFNPATNIDQMSQLRLINPGEAAAQVTVAGIDGNGKSSSGTVRLAVPAGVARTFAAQELESGGVGFEGALGDGAGKWQLVVDSDQPIHVMSLLSNPTGHLTNLSTAPANVDGDAHTVPMFPAAADPHGRMGFVRVINHSQEAGVVTIDAFDDTDRDFAPSTLALKAGETMHFNSDDLEMGNRDKGLTGGSGGGDGDWRLTLSSDLDIEVLSYIRTPKDGFLTAMHDTVPRERNRHRVATFNPGSNVHQKSQLRLVNAGGETAEVRVTGIDGRGERSSRSVSISVPAGTSRTLTAQELEAGGGGFAGKLGDGARKWQLVVESEQSIIVMSLLSSPTGHLTNLSTAPGADFTPAGSSAFNDRFAGRRLVGDDPAAYPDLLAGNRFRKTEGTQTYEGGYTYTRTGRNQATVVFDYDNGGSCTFVFTFQSRTAGGSSYTCDDGESGKSNWHLVETPPGASIEADLDVLLDGVAEIGAPGAPGPFCVYGPDAFPVIVGASGGNTRAPVVAAGRWKDGRIVALGHDGYFERATIETADTARFLANALQWAGGENASARIGVAGAAELGAWLTESGYSAVEVALTPESLAAVDVVAVKMWNQTVSEADALGAFVRTGGGLVTAATGWGWAYLHPHLSLVSAFAGNRLLAAVGVQWFDEYLQRTSARGYAADGPPDALTHALAALDAVEAHEASRTMGQPEIDQAVATLERAARCLPPDDRLLAPRLRALVDTAESEERWPTEDDPIRKSDLVARLAATLYVIEHDRTPAESVRAYPAAADFPGAVPADAPRIVRRLTIDTVVPRWHSTGLYAAPGELVTVTVPAAAAESGALHVRVGAHSDGIWRRAEWTRMPEISRRFPVSGPRTRVANAFGGLIYVEVPSDVDLGKVAVEIEGAVAAPRFVLGETDPGAWRAEIRHAPAPWAEIEGRNMVVTTDAREVRELDDPRAVAETWDTVLDLNAELAEWSSPRTSPERFVVDRQISVGYMHDGYPLMAHLDQKANLVDAAHLRAGHWGVFHEVGHNHQSRDWTFDGTLEVTVNLFTLYVYEFLCGIPVAEHERGSPVFRTEQMARYDFDQPDFEQWKRDPFLALVMYEQLQQEFGWEAFRRVFAEYRDLANADRPRSDDDKRDQWLVRFSRTVGRNLGPFFEAWGVPTSQAARDEVADLPVWLPTGFP